MTLGLDPAAKPGQISRRAYDAMTRDDDRNWISSICRPNGSKGLRFSEAPCLLGITYPFAVGNVPQLAPGPHLKLGSHWLQGYLELRSPFFKVFRYLRCRQIQNCIASGFRSFTFERCSPESQANQSPSAGNNRQLADG